MYFTCRQQDNLSYKTYEHVFGTIGQADLLQHKIHGPNQWKYREKERSGYRIEHEELFASIRNGEPKVDEYMCDSTMIAIMGRMSTYTSKVITWEDCIDSDARLGPEEYAWTDVPEPPVPVPGVTSIA